MLRGSPPGVVCSHPSGEKGPFLASFARRLLPLGNFLWGFTRDLAALLCLFLF